MTSRFESDQEPLTNPTAATAEVVVATPVSPQMGSPGTRLPIAVCFGWGIGAVTMAMMGNIFNLLVLRFATDFLGIAAGVAGLLLAVSKLYDAFTDPLVGTISDNWKSPRGRRRPFLLFAAFLCALSIVGLFFVPDVSGVTLLVYYTFALLMFATAYTLWAVPYLAMSAEMTEDYHDRSRLVSYRVNGGAVGLLLSSICGPWLLVYLGGGQRGYQGMALVIAALIVITGLACYRLTREAPFKLRTPRVKTPLKVQIRLILQNRPLTLLLIKKALWYFGFACNQAALAFFIKYVARLSDFWLGAYYMVLPFGIIASQPVWLRLSKIIEKKYALMLAMGLFGALELSWLLSGPDESIVIIVLRLLGLGFGAGGAILLTQSMFNDTIEYDYRLTGQRREGAFTGLFSLVDKGFTALGVASLGMFIGAMGYISSKGGAVVEQPDTAVMAIAIGFAVAPFITASLSIVVMAFYNLSQEKLEAARA